MGVPFFFEIVFIREEKMGFKKNKFNTNKLIDVGR